MSDNQSLKKAAHRYYNELLPMRRQIENEAKQKLDNANDEILGGLVEEIRNNIPEGKWKKFFENTFSFGLPSKQKLECDKICLWKNLEDRLDTIIGVPFLFFSRDVILNAGFTSWNNFVEKLPEFNKFIGDVFIIDLPTEEIPKKIEKYGFTFRITCMPEENRKKQKDDWNSLLELSRKM